MSKMSKATRLAATIQVPASVQDPEARNIFNQVVGALKAISMENDALREEITNLKILQGDGIIVEKPAPFKYRISAEDQKTQQQVMVDNVAGAKNKLVKNPNSTSVEVKGNKVMTADEAEDLDDARYNYGNTVKIHNDRSNNKFFVPDKVETDSFRADIIEVDDSLKLRINAGKVYFGQSAVSNIAEYQGNVTAGEYSIVYDKTNKTVMAAIQKDYPTGADIVIIPVITVSSELIIQQHFVGDIVLDTYMIALREDDKQPNYLEEKLINDENAYYEFLKPIDTAEDPMKQRVLGLKNAGIGYCIVKGYDGTGPTDSSNISLRNLKNSDNGVELIKTVADEDVDIIIRGLTSEDGSVDITANLDGDAIDLAVDMEQVMGEVGVKHSITKDVADGNKLKLVGDVETLSDIAFYGCDANGNKGWYAPQEATAVTKLQLGATGLEIKTQKVYVFTTEAEGNADSIPTTNCEEA